MSARVEFWVNPGESRGDRPVPFVTSHIIGRENKRTNNRTMRLETKRNGAAGYLGSVKLELRKDEGQYCESQPRSQGLSSSRPRKPSPHHV